ncbi:MAG: DUF2079 domain-containing protein, partial [Bacteroidia bacterium]
LTLKNIMLLVFGVIYSSISLVNHYKFRTFGLDLGIYNNALYDFSHFHSNNYSIMDHMFSNILSDHFSLIPFIVSPLYWIFDSYTMLVFQVFIMLFGAAGIYKIFQLRSAQKFIPELAMLHFLGIWALYSALSFDYHDNVTAAMLLPWFFYYVQVGDWKKSIVFYLLIIVSKENMALWSCFICLGLAIHYYKDKKKMKRLLLLSVFSVVYFWVIINYVMPFFRDTRKDAYLHFNFDVIGSNFGEAILTILQKPGYCFKLLFVSPDPDPILRDIKEELHFMVIVSGGYALLFRPYYFLMLIPIYAQKMWNNDFGKWGMNAQYSIEFAPVLTTCLFSVLCSIKNHRLVYILSIAAVALTFWFTIAKLDWRHSLWFNKAACVPYIREHYVTPYNVKEIYKVLKLIPKEAKVSASNNAVPHLCNRETIYIFPKVNDADHVLILNYPDCAYPLNMEQMKQQIEEFKANPNWTPVYMKHNIFLFKKIK